MADDRDRLFEYKGGRARVKVLVSKRAQGQDDVEEDEAGDEGENGPYTVAGDEDDLIPQKGQITIYDLGIRLGQDEEYDYVEIAPIHTQFGNAGASLLYTQHYHAALLSGNPFDKSEGGKDMALRFPQATEFVYVDLVLRREGQPDSKHLIGYKNKRYYVADMPTPAHLVSPNITETKWANKGLLKFDKSGKWHLAIEASLFYNTIDTEDVENYKITAGPDPTGPVVEFQYKRSQKMRIYLTPRLMLTTNTVGLNLGDPFTIRFGRLPVLSGFEPEETRPFSDIRFDPPSLTEGFGDGLTAIAKPAFWQLTADVAGFNANVNKILVTLGAAALSQQGAGPALAAVLIIGSRRYYVWRVGPTLFNEDLYESGIIYNPAVFEGGVIPLP